MLQLSNKIKGGKLTHEEWNNHALEKENAVTKVNLPLGDEVNNLFNAMDKLSKMNCYSVVSNAECTEYTVNDRFEVDNTTITDGLIIGVVIDKANKANCKLNYANSGLKYITNRGDNLTEGVLRANGFYKLRYLNGVWNLIQDELLPQSENRIKYGTDYPYDTSVMVNYKNKHFKKVASVRVRKLSNNSPSRNATEEDINDADRRGYYDAVNDGRYVYYIPFYNENTSYHGKLVILDTFTGWITERNLGVIDSSYVGFRGGAYNGEYVVLAPYHDRKAVLIPTGNSYENNDGIISVDITNNDIRDVDGACSDGDNIYFAPSHNEAGEKSSICPVLNTNDMTVTYRDISGGIADAKCFRGAFILNNKIFFAPSADQATGSEHGYLSVWDLTTDSIRIIDIPSITGEPNAVGFCGGLTDARYVYLAPLGQDNKWLVKVNSTDYNDVTLIDVSLGTLEYRGYSGAVTDGRYIYLTPWVDKNDEFHGHVVIYDMLENAVIHQDISKAGGGLKGFIGGTYLNGVVYFAPTKYGHDSDNWSTYSAEITSLNKRF